MGANEMEFLGKYRFFKYRYAQEFPANYGTIAETWTMSNQVSRYENTADYLRRTFNIRTVFNEHKIGYFDLLQGLENPENFYDKHCVMFPVPLSYFADLVPNYSPSSPFETAKTIIVTTGPKKVVSTSLSLLALDNIVVALTGLSILMVSVLLVFYFFAMNRYKFLPLKSMAYDTVENIWHYSALMCNEALPVVLPQMTPRLLASSWIIGLTFILFFFGCYLCTEFTIESYNYIDTLSDLIESGVPPLIIEGGGAFAALRVLVNTSLSLINHFDVIAQVQANEDQVVKKWFEGLTGENFITLMDLLDFEGYIPVISGEKALIISETYLMWLFGEVLNSDPTKKAFFAEQGGFYFSKEQVRFDYLSTIYNTSWINSVPQLKEFGQTSVQTLFESKTFNYLDFESRYPMDFVTWKKPMETSTNIDISSIAVPFYVLFLLLSISFASSFFEIFFQNLF